MIPLNLETEEQSAREDRLRARRARRVRNRPGPLTWLNMRDRFWLFRQRPLRALSPNLDDNAVLALAEQLEAGVDTAFPPQTMASSLRMRVIRIGLGRALLDAFADYPDESLQTVTVLYSGWSYTPPELESVTAAQLKNQFRQHLHRAGVLQMPGPLYAVLHGEFEPTSARFQLHYHLITTVEKAAALKRGLRADLIAGYVRTSTGASPVRRSSVRNRVRQLTYLAKSFWPSKPVITINGKPKRIRRYRRIPEPFGTQVLLWLDRQKFNDLIVANDCWSPRIGGTEAMRRLYLFGTGVG